MPKVIDLDKYKEQREELRKEVKKLSSLHNTELGHVENLAIREARLLEAQAEVLDALLNDISMLVGRHLEMQNQFIVVSAQAFLALQILREKNIIMPEELQARWEGLMKKTMGEEDQVATETTNKEASQAVNQLVEQLGGYEPTEEDIHRILEGEDPQSVFPDFVFSTKG